MQVQKTEVQIGDLDGGGVAFQVLRYQGDMHDRIPNVDVLNIHYDSPV